MRTPQHNERWRLGDLPAGTVIQFRAVTTGLTDKRGSSHIVVGAWDKPDEAAATVKRWAIAKNAVVVVVVENENPVPFMTIEPDEIYEDE